MRPRCPDLGMPSRRRTTITWWTPRLKSARFQESDFDESGGHYRVIVDSDPSAYDMRKIVAMLRRLVSSATAWMGDRPFQTYLFFYHFRPGAPGNGMEHANGTAIDFSPETWRTIPRDSWA